MNSRNILIVIVVIVLVVAGGLFLAKNNANAPTVQNTNSVSPTAANTTQESGSPSPSDTMSQSTVTLTSNGFEPQTITIKVGENVTWINKSGDVATVNSDVHPTHLLYPPLNLGQFSDGDKLELTFTKAGTFGYHDHLHPERTGKVVVQ